MNEWQSMNGRVERVAIRGAKIEGNKTGNGESKKIRRMRRIAISGVQGERRIAVSGVRGERRVGASKRWSKFNG